MKTLLFVFSFSLITSVLFAQHKKEILFIGNSYTAVNNLPQMVTDLALSKGDTVSNDYSYPGGYTFQMHSVYAATIAKINLKKWDYVILQEQSQLPSFDPSQVAAECYPFADSLNRLIKTNDSCTTTLFYMTWGRKNGDASNCATYPPVCTYLGMQARLRESYLEMGATLNAEVSPVGVVWREVRKDYPAIELYNPDESHPSLAGSYLAACTFYASIYHKSPVGAAWPAGIDSTTAAIFQHYADSLVFDSLSLWNIDTTAVRAGFNVLGYPPYQVQFTNTSDNADLFSWDFGDGNTSSEINPNHTYSGPGNYTIQLTAYRGCDSSSASIVVSVTPSGLMEKNEKASWKIYPNPASDEISIFSDSAAENIFEIKIYNTLGSPVLCVSAKAGDKLNVSSLAPGCYTIQIITGLRYYTGRIIILRD